MGCFGGPGCAGPELVKQVLGIDLAEREGFDPSIRVDPVYRISRSLKGVVKGDMEGAF